MSLPHMRGSLALDHTSISGAFHLSNFISFKLSKYRNFYSNKTVDNIKKPNEMLYYVLSKKDCI